MLKSIAFVIACVGSVLVATYATAADSSGKVQASAHQRYKVVIQVSDNDPSKWNLALNNANNVQTDVGAANADIEIVAYGPGINMLKIESSVGERIREAMAAGVRVAACENTMHAAKLSKEDMLPALTYVPTGVVELIERQQQGYAYIKP